MGKHNGAKWLQRKKRLALYARDGFACAYCGTSDKLSLDHLVPRVRKRGHNGQSNLITACVTCNQRKGNRPWKAFVGCDEKIAHINRLRRRTIKPHLLWAQSVLDENDWPIALRIRE